MFEHAGWNDACTGRTLPRRQERLAMRILASLFVVSLLGCAADLDTGRAEPFASDEELERYLASIPEPPQPLFRADSFAPAPSVAEAAPGPDANESITNVQEAGVDEGGIVKNVGSFLVVLRRGQLVAVDVSTPGQPVQRSVIDVAPDAALRDGVWYDELLVRGRELVVVGYRYDLKVGLTPTGATELNRFTLAEDGALTRGKTVFFESWDYFSGRNYASRLVGDQLVFYMPVGAFVGKGLGRTARLPRQVTWHGQHRFSFGAALVPGSAVTRPPVRPANSSQAVFHTVLRCTLDLACAGQSVLAGYSREFYVSPRAIFLSVDRAVYRIGLADGAVGLHALEGRPLDQFSFRERLDTLEVVTVTAQGTGSAALFSKLPLADFDVTGAQPTTPTVLATADWFQRTRFVDDFVYLLQRAGSFQLRVHHLPSSTNQTVPVDQVTRIEPLAGVGALVIDSSFSPRSLTSSLTLRPFLHAGATATAASPVVFTGGAEGESRSHGFFFRPSALGGGRFGLPVTATSSGWWGEGASNIAFFDVGANAAVSLAGTVSSTARAGSACVSSCVDWYGNTRPIFLRDRHFALMGNELKELDGAQAGLPVLGSVAFSTP
jgi:hypothetical protein